MLRMNLKVSQFKERSCSVVWWYGSGYFCIACQMATGCDQGGYYLLVSFGFCADTSPHRVCLQGHEYPGYEAYPSFDHIRDMAFTWNREIWHCCSCNLYTTDFNRSAAIACVSITSLGWSRACESCRQWSETWIRRIHATVSQFLSEHSS